MENFDYPGVKGRLYLVTGASSGIGRACSDILSRLGATVILNGRNEAELEKTMDALAGNGHIVASGNLIELNFKKWLPELAEKAGKPLAGLAHCAGSHTPAPLRAFRYERLVKQLEEHSAKSAELFYAFCMMKNREPKSSVAAMTSVSALKGIAANAFYGAARAALDSLCRSFAVEFAQAGVRFNCVCGGLMPGTKMTDSYAALRGDNFLESASAVHPLGLGKPEDAANALVFLLGTASQWITGTQILVDGGYIAKGN